MSRSDEQDWMYENDGNFGGTEKIKGKSKKEGTQSVNSNRDKAKKRTEKESGDVAPLPEELPLAENHSVDVEMVENQKKIQISGKDFVYIARDLSVVKFGGEKADKREPLERLEKLGIKLPDFNEKDLVNREKYKTALERLSSPPKDQDKRYRWGSIEEAKKYFYEIHDLVEVDRSEKKEPYYVYKKVEKKEPPKKEEKEDELVYPGFFGDLNKATLKTNPDSEWQKARENLEKNGIYLERILLDEDTEKAINTVASNKPDGKYNSVIEAKEFLRTRFLKEKVQDEKKHIVEDERGRSAYVLELRKIAQAEGWNKMVDQLNGLDEPNKTYAFGYLKVAYDWYIHPDQITRVDGGLTSWNKTYKVILNKLGIKTDE